ncbi:beta-glucosidase 13-like [Pyrus x bretschneideri]|uniref:beta-glucosidase 13-like n=1 Tax=Pyrus x bretschneideri TaxID=225117 RepID=UPI0020308DA2|nr:beta-glucosidase 13-like [Pyrus x bretschneideri]
MLLQKEKLLCVIAAAIFLMASLLSAEAQQVEVMNSSSAAPTLELNVHRADFPVDFFFGVGTSAAQTEGAAEEEGRSPSVWDHRAKILPGAIRQSDKFPKAIDGYRRFMEDIQLIKELGVNSYRFSVSWTRILPQGTISGGVNQLGVDHYNRLINELIRNGIEPFVTIYHFDLPQVLQEKYGGLTHQMFLKDFSDYAELCFKLFGDRVRHWFTINEPNVLAQYGYELGIAPPGRCSLPQRRCGLGSPPRCMVPVGPCNFGGNSSTEPYIAAHHIILAHATAVKLYRERYQVEQNGEIGIVLATKYFKPYSNSQEDRAAAERLFDFYLGWFMGPLVLGKYPQSMRELVKERLPTFSADEISLVKGNLGFVGINYYESVQAKYRPPPPTENLSYSFDSWAEEKGYNLLCFLICLVIAVIKDVPGVSENHWPQGLQKLMNYVKNKYSSPQIYISENGYGNPKNDRLPLDEQLKDPNRISYIARHLYWLNKAMKNGANVKGYFCWALFDDFEWGIGLSQQVGLYYIDFDDNYKRYPKQSAKWFRDFNHNSASISRST